jgi:hypothetical protein
LKESIKKLEELIIVSSNGEVQSFLKFIKKQIEINELILLTSFRTLKNNSEIKRKIDLLDSRFHVALNPCYFARRWDKFYAQGQNKRFNKNIKNKIYQRDKFLCQYCGFEKKIEIHHVIPQDLGGSHSEYNLVCACENCNRSIGNSLRLPRNWWKLHPESNNVI